MKQHWYFIQKDEFEDLKKVIAKTEELLLSRSPSHSLHEVVTYKIVTPYGNIPVLRKCENYYGISYYKNTEVVGKWSSI